MTHRFCISSDQRQGEAVTFSADQWHQLHTVLRLGIGDAVRVFDGTEPVDHLVELVGAASGRTVGLAAQAREPRTRLVMYPALLSRDKFESVLQKLTEVGAAAIAPVITARALVRRVPDEHRQARWRAILREAAEQCGRGRVPSLLPTLDLADAVQRATAEGAVLMAHEQERRHSLRRALLSLRPAPAVGEGPAGGPVVSLFVGPEGGYAPEETAVAVAAGARLVSLGPRLLRTETASPIMAALVLYELGDLSSAEDDCSSPG